MSKSDSNALGLRERKKRETRSALRKAALHLVLERGLERVTVEDISARAGYAPRTFFNYFRSKEAALIIEPEEELGNLLDNLPTELQLSTLVDDLWSAMLQQLHAAPIEVADMNAHHEIMERYPELLPQQLRVFAAEERRMAEALRQRCGSESSWPHVEVATSLAMSVMRSAFAQWVRDDGNHPLETFLRTAIGIARELVPATSTTGEPNCPQA